MLPTISSALAAKPGGHHQRPQQWQRQDNNKESAESPSLRGEQEQQQPQGPAPFPPPSSTTNNSDATHSNSSRPNLEDLVDRFFAQARCKFSEQFDEMAKTMSRAMKDEIALRAEQERQRRSEWEASVADGLKKEASVVDGLKKELNKMCASRDQLVGELDKMKMLMMDTPSPLKSGMLFTSGRDPKLPCVTPAAGARQLLRTPASTLSLSSLSSASEIIDVTVTSGNGMSPSPFPGRFSTASAINNTGAAAAAAAAQFTWLAAYYSGNRSSITSDAPAPAAPPILAPNSSVASATPAASVSRVDIPSTFDSVLDIVDEHHPTAEITADVSETVSQPTAVKTVASSPTVAVTGTIACSVPEGDVTGKARDASVIATSAAVAVATKPKATTPSFIARSSSAERPSSMPVGGLSRQELSVPAGLPFAVSHDEMPPPQPQPRTPFSAIKSPMCFGATSARTPLGIVSMNTINFLLSSNVFGMKKTAGSGSAGRSDGSGLCFVDGGSIGGDDKCRAPLVAPAASHDGHKVTERVRQSVGHASPTASRCKVSETARQGVGYASPTASSATKTGDGDGVGKGRDSKSSSGIAIPTRSKKVIPQSQRILHSATRESRAAAAAAATTTATKHSTRRASTVKTTLPVSKARTTRSATLRSTTTAINRRGSFMKF